MPQPDASSPADRGAASQDTVDTPTPFDFKPLDTPVSTTLRGVWGASVDDVWVGSEGFSLLASASVLHVEKGVVKQYSTGSADSVRAISGTAANDVWFVATLSDASHHTILHWDGVQLSQALGESASSSSLAAIWARTPQDVWAVGDRLVLRLQGGVWSKPPTITPSLFETFHGTAVAGASATSVLFGQASGSAYCWKGSTFGDCGVTTPHLHRLVRAAAGSYWGWDGTVRAVVKSGDGVSWQTVRTFTKDEPIPVGIAASSDSEVWLATTRIAVPGGYEGPFVDRYDGAAWRRSPLKTQASLTDIAVVDRSVWVVGTQGYVARCLLD